MGISYATIETLYRHGVPRGALTSPARLIASASASTNRLELEGHALAEEAVCTLSVDPGGVLPAPLQALTPYYAKLVDLGGGVVSESLFELSASAGGAAIDLTTSGTAPFRMHISLIPTALTKIEYASRLVDGFAIAHEVPFVEPFPIEVVELVSKRAAVELLFAVRKLSVDDYDRLVSIWARDAGRLELGKAFRDATATAKANLATASSASYGSASRERTDTLP